MVRLTTLILAALPLAALATSHSQETVRRKRQHRHVSRLQSRASSYTLQEKYQGQSFFDNFNFFTGNDPTNGQVNYLSQTDATNAGIAFVQSDNTTVLAVDNTSQLASGAKRNSVRISSKKTFSKGLFIADFYAMPHGCGVWPAWWSSADPWPVAGEIDVIEGVNNQLFNQYTLHTDDGCTLDNNPPTTDGLAAFSANILGTQCASGAGSNAGCAFSDTRNTSFGEGFNRLAGGVYAHEWTNSSIKMWHFQRNEIPADITSGNPDPSTWPTPAAFWSSATCDISSHFYNHALTLDITLCGDWANGAYASSGCPGTCSDAVANPSNFNYAKWKVNYIAVYQQS
ncbi:hypothetical protein EW146_g5219 [Bondarzewia mesenterica]|uniref:GH16 domain-containing protein n=1 Tax=Bondarzewia mesenterica TaxID=1095465 RepID=A0A4S4LS53_9AGAM|nr:hypothetical protein EW146_g5219 [Bondarzewia mesenterica]